MLKRIIQNKKKEIKANKKNLPLNSFKNKLENSKRNFKDALSNGRLSLIAEFKRKSPSQSLTGQKSDLINSSRFSEIIKIYDRYADAISVLTDKRFFGGSLTDMQNAARLAKLPILRKDFIIDEYQVYESRLYNADAILLIASQLTKNEINKFIAIAKEFNMSCLVEVHTEDELIFVLGSDAEIIGINNRNLETLKIDTEKTLKLMDKVPKDKIIVSESGISSGEYIKKIKGKVNAVLVGTYLMDSENTEEAMKIFNSNDKN